MIIQNGVGITSLLNANTLKQALNPANETVARGIYNATTLSTVDGDLATANIKNGITLFGFAGSVDVRDVSDANALVGEVKTGRTFYAVGGARKTGTGTKTLNPANETVAAGYYAATTLSAVDVNLAVGNIKSSVNIFGFVGTYAQSLAEDILGSGQPIDTADQSGSGAVLSTPITAGGDYTCATKTQAYDASSLAVAVGFINQKNDTASQLKLRVFMDGVQVAESAYFSAGNTAQTIIVLGTRALSGSTVCLVKVHNYGGTSNNLKIGCAYSGTGEEVATGIGIGSVKLA